MRHSPTISGFSDCREGFSVSGKTTLAKSFSETSFAARGRYTDVYAEQEGKRCFFHPVLLGQSATGRR